MAVTHDLLLLGGCLGLIGILAGQMSARFGAPLLLVLLGIGMAAGADGLGLYSFADFRRAYLIGSGALAIILFEGGLRTRARLLRLVFWPALSLATVGILVTASITTLAALLVGAPLAGAMLLGAALSPTDAAAVSSLL